MQLAFMLFLTLVPARLFSQAVLSESMIGSWINTNDESRGVTQVAIRRDENRTVVHAWGSCRPIHCDWGEAECESWNGIPMVTWKLGIRTTWMQLIPQSDGRLLVAYRSEYHDGSGRQDPGSAEFFVRENQQSIAPEIASAKALLQKVAETYQSLPPTRFEVTETINRTTDRTESRTRTHSTILFGPPNKLRIDKAGASESSVMIADGQTVWTVYPDANEYVKVPQGNSPILPFALLDKNRGTPRITGHEWFQGAECTVVQISSEGGVTQELWIDAAYLVRRDKSEVPPSSKGGASKRETLYSMVQPENIRLEAFSYDPALTQAKNRIELSREAAVSLKGNPAPDFALKNLDGYEVRLSDLRGKPVLLDFWGTWCGYCRESLPLFELVHRTLKHKGLLVFGVDSEPAEIARDYLLRLGYTLPSLVDLKEETTVRYHVERWPTTVLIDRNGTVVYYESGSSPEKLRDAIASLGLW